MSDMVSQYGESMYNQFSIVYLYERCAVLVAETGLLTLVNRGVDFVTARNVGTGWSCH